MVKTLSGATTPSQNGPGSDGNEEVLRISQSSSITGISPSDFLVSYPGHSLVGGGLSSLKKEKAVGAFYNPSRLGKENLSVWILIYNKKYKIDIDL